MFWLFKRQTTPAAPWTHSPTMTMTRFIEELASTPFQWHLRGGLLRTADDNDDCPETAVARHLTGREFSTDQWKDAAAAITQPRGEAEAVTLAADNTPGHIPGLRALLLAATVNRSTSQAPTPAHDRMDLTLAELVASGQPQAVKTEEHELLQV